MTKFLLQLTAVAALLIGYWSMTQADSPTKTSEAIIETKTHDGNVKTAVFAGGCFWCIESDFEKLDGVYEAVSGYSGGSEETANYKTVSYTETGHFEAVEVSYDPNKVSYSELLEYFWTHIDPTDPNGQFCDKGSSYRSAIFYANADEKSIVDKSLAALKESKPFKYDIVTTIAEATPFYRAEEYHQDYYKKNPIRYRIYRKGCGRDKTIKALWNK
jgi:methionine-S-sulfoxide reductase